MRRNEAGRSFRGIRAPLPDAPSPRRRRAFRWIAVGAPVVLLALAEVSLRAFVPEDRGDAAPHADRRLELTDGRLFEPDDELFWRFLPARTFRLDDTAYPPFRTNALGLRGTDIPPEKADGEIRVVCAGDSVTFGLGLRDGETFPERLEVRLRDDVRLLGRQVRVVNAGTPGYSSVQGLRLLRRLVPLRPDVVVWWFGMSDAKTARVRDAEMRLPGDFERTLAETVGRLRLVGAARRLLADEDGDPVRVPPADFSATIAELRELAARERFSVVFVRCPNRLDATLSGLREVVAAAESLGTEEVRAPYPVISAWSPSPSREPFRVFDEPRSEGGRRVVVESGPLASDRVVPLAEVRRNRDSVERWRATLTTLLDRLPEDSLRSDGLFRGVPERDAMSDNSHLTSAGASLVGDSLAAAVLARLDADGLLGRR